LTELSKNQDWRIRLQCTEIFKTLSTQLGSKFFTKEILKILKMLLKDRIFIVKKSSIDTLKSISMHIGME